MDEITDEESLEKWLEARPEETRWNDALSIFVRSTMRLVPLFVSDMRGEWARQRGLTSIVLFRALVCASVAKYFAQTEAHTACRLASNTCGSILSLEISPEEIVASGAITGLLAAQYTAGLGASRNQLDIENPELPANFESASWLAITRDAEALLMGDDILEQIIWPEFLFDRFAIFDDETLLNGQAKHFAERWVRARTSIETMAGYDFWLRWYEAALAGQPLTGDWESHWALLRDIALIPDADWKRGALHVAGLIEIFEEKHRLKQEFSDWKRLLDDEIYNRQTLGHHRSNLPDDFPDPLVWQYESCQEEAQKIFEDADEVFNDAIPDPEKLLGISDRLLALWKRLSFLGKCGITAGAFVLTQFFGGIAAEAGADFYHVAKPAIMQRLEKLAEQIKQRPVAPETPAPNQTGWDEPPLEL